MPPTATLQPGNTLVPSSATPTASPTPAALITFIDSGQYLGQGNGRCVIVGDVDGDGDSDVLISIQDHASALWLNDGTGKFTRSDQFFKTSTCAVLGDMNGDKSLDIFFTEGTSNHVWLNNGKGKFSKTSQSLVSPDSSAVALGDLDDDGDLDVFVSTNTWAGGDDRPKLWLNQLKTTQ